MAVALPNMKLNNLGLYCSLYSIAVALISVCSSFRSLIFISISIIAVLHL